MVSIILDFDIHIQANNGILHWNVHFAKHLANSNDNDDLDFIYNIASELKKSIEKIQSAYSNIGVSDNVRWHFEQYISIALSLVYVPGNFPAHDISISRQLYTPFNIAPPQ